MAPFYSLHCHLLEQSDLGCQMQVYDNLCSLMYWNHSFQLMCMLNDIETKVATRLHKINHNNRAIGAHTTIVLLLSISTGMSPVSLKQWFPSCFLQSQVDQFIADFQKHIEVMSNYNGQQFAVPKSLESSAPAPEEPDLVLKKSTC